MVKVKVISLLLIMALTFNLVTPLAYASNYMGSNTIKMNTPVTNENYTVSGSETTDFRFNILIDNATQTGQFALVYLDSPDYMYEFTFDLSSLPSSHDFSAIQTYCFDNKDQWREIYLPTSVSVIQLDENQPQTFATDSNVTYFDNWLIDKFGNEYNGKLLSTKTQSGTTMYLKTAFQVYTYKDRSYLIRNTMTVIGFVTGILGLSSGATAVAVIGLIAGADGLLHMNQSVYEYKLRASWLKYATVVSGTGYPYGLADKSTYYTGYVYTGTGGRNVDTASASTFYDPSSTVYNTNTKIFDNAFREYDTIGFQEGNF